MNRLFHSALDSKRTKKKCYIEIKKQNLTHIEKRGQIDLIDLMGLNIVPQNRDPKIGQITHNSHPLNVKLPRQTKSNNTLSKTKHQIAPRLLKIAHSTKDRTFS